ncbi:MAG TPA: efflux RND transporter periplasmic adaptor subunit [Hyphomonadaceae bacterium]|nr:efflux RND transporter periplasmic adaptor subunit [Hyphomonadaceae bacterium]
MTVATQPVTLTTELSGRTNPYAIAEVRPQVSGLIRERLFKEGAVVKAGQPLYQIDPAPYQAAKDQAAAQLASAQATLVAAQAKAARYKKLIESQAISQQDADDTAAAARQAEAAVEQASATLKTAEINLGYTRILAPIDGTIGRSSVTPGALVTTNQADPLTTIWRLDPMYVDITESSTRIMQLRRALQTGSIAPAAADVTLTLDDGSTYVHAGRIEFAETAVDQATGSVTIRATVPNPERLLLPGMFVRVKVAQGVKADGILVPQQGVSRDATGGATALVVGEGDKVEPRKLVADRSMGDQWLITSGLKAGDRVIVEGTDRVKPGQTVKPVPVTLSAQK